MVLVAVTVWTKDDLAQLRAWRDDGLSAGQIAKLTGRTRSAVCGQLVRQRLTAGKPRDVWSKAKEQQLIEGSLTMRPAELAALLGTTVAAVNGRLTKLRREGRITREHGRHTREFSVQKVRAARNQDVEVGERHEVPVAPVAPGALRKPLEALGRDECRMPLWNGRDDPRVFCALPAVPGTSWCPACLAITARKAA